jgi:hypothetical protein
MRPRDEQRQALQKCDWLESEMRCAVRPWMPQRDPDLLRAILACPRSSSSTRLPAICTCVHDF